MGDAAAGERAGAGGLRRAAGADLVGLHAHARPASFPRRTRAICWSTCNCPTRPRWSGPKRSCAASKRSPGKTQGVKHTVAIAGQSILLDANAPNFGAMYVMLDDFHHRAAREPVRRRHRRRVAGAVPGRRSPTGMVNVLRRPAGRRPGHRRRLQDHDRRPRRQRPDALQAVGRQDRRRREASTELAGLFTSFRANTPWLYLDIDRTQAKTMGVSMSRRLQHAASLPRLAVRQRLQPLRPHLAGERAGRRRFPQANRRPQAAQDPQRPRADGAAWARWPASATISGPVMIVRYNMYPAAPINGNAAPGVSSGQAIEQMEEVGQRADLPPVDARPSGPNWPCCNCRPATRPCWCFCWPWCWCSWCWPPSTKAGRCRWP